MSGRMNWVKVENERKLNFRPSARSLPPTERQINYILGLAMEKGQPRPKLPKTKHGASELIQKLLNLPDVAERIPWEPIKPESAKDYDTRKDLVVELREAFPALTPMTANSLVQLAEAMYDSLEVAFMVADIGEDKDYAPEGLSDLVQWLLKRFLAFSAA